MDDALAVLDVISFLSVPGVILFSVALQAKGFQVVFAEEGVHQGPDVLVMGAVELGADQPDKFEESSDVVDVMGLRLVESFMLRVWKPKELPASLTCVVISLVNLSSHPWPIIGVVGRVIAFSRTIYAVALGYPFTAPTASSFRFSSVEYPEIHELGSGDFQLMHTYSGFTQCMTPCSDALQITASTILTGCFVALASCCTIDSGSVL